MKQVEITHTTESYIEQFIVRTGDSEQYTFVLLPWMKYPFFSHRLSVTDDGTERSYNNHLPTKVKEKVRDEYGNYLKPTFKEATPSEDVINLF